MGGETKTTSLPRWFQAVVIGRRPAWTLVRLGTLILGTLIVFNFVLTRPIRVTGISMEPTFRNGQVNFINRLAFWRHPPRRGDIVAIRFSGESLMYLKRVVGLPGESIAFRNGKLYINDEEIEEPYVKYPCDWNMQPRLLGADEYYVVGDNRSMPIKQHDQGVATRQRIIGKVLFGGNT